jgi:hypothetical protein
MVARKPALFEAGRVAAGELMAPARPWKPARRPRLPRRGHRLGASYIEAMAPRHGRAEGAYSTVRDRLKGLCRAPTGTRPGVTTSVG